MMQMISLRALKLIPFFQFFETATAARHTVTISDDYGAPAAKSFDAVFVSADLRAPQLKTLFLFCT